MHFPTDYFEVKKKKDDREEQVASDLFQCLAGSGFLPSSCHREHWGMVFWQKAHRRMILHCFCCAQRAVLEEWELYKLC